MYILYAYSVYIPLYICIYIFILCIYIYLYIIYYTYYAQMKTHSLFILKITYSSAQSYWTRSRQLQIMLTLNRPAAH